MIFRDRRLVCPHCGDPLQALDSREKWRCAGCGGVAVAGEQLEREFGEAGRELLLETITGIRTTRHCPHCSEPMTAFSLAGVELDRCTDDGLIWFDRGELGRARSTDPFVSQLVVSLREL